MVKFRKPYESVSSVPSNSGETKKPVYTLVNRNGERSLKQVDEIDIPSYINSFEAETDLKSMLKRYALTGDMSYLKRGGTCVYADVADCETNFARLIESSREIALLQLQASQVGQEMSKNGQEKDSAVTDPLAPEDKNIPNSESEVNHE